MFALIYRRPQHLYTSVQGWVVKQWFDLLRRHWIFTTSSTSLLPFDLHCRRANSTGFHLRNQYNITLIFQFDRSFPPQGLILYSLLCQQTQLCQYLCKYFKSTARGYIDLVEDYFESLQQTVIRCDSCFVLFWERPVICSANVLM